MKKFIRALTLFCIINSSAQAQIISQFNWNSNPVTQAVAGPNATSVSSTATSSTGGAGGTNGLNPGLGRNEIAMFVPGATFQQTGLDISVDFARQENGASFFTLGGLDFGISGGSIYVKFLLRESGSDVTINLTNKFTTPTDVNFHNYRFIYDNASGKVSLYLDGVAQYNAQVAPAGTPLSWTGATNVEIGSGMDGSNTNVPVLDNLLVQYPPILLPLQLLSFDARTEGAVNELSWTTTREVSTLEFIVERSSDGVKYEAIGTVATQQNYSGNTSYQFTDNSPVSVNFYRLKMVDVNGNFSYSGIKDLGGMAAAVSISCYPNPVVDQVNIRIDYASVTTCHYSVITLDGKVIQSGHIQTGSGQTSLDLSTAPKGILLIRIQQDNDTAVQGTGGQSQLVKTFKILRQ